MVYARGWRSFSWERFMKPNRIKQIMREGGLALVSHVGFADPAVVEIIARAGFDGAFIDMELSLIHI